MGRRWVRGWRGGADTSRGKLCQSDLMPEGCLVASTGGRGRGGAEAGEAGEASKPGERVTTLRGSATAGGSRKEGGEGSLRADQI